MLIKERLSYSVLIVWKLTTCHWSRY